MARKWRFLGSVLPCCVFLFLGVRLTLALSPDESRDYQRVTDLVKGGHEKEALLSLDDFLRRYPQSILKGGAELLKGEIYFSMGFYEEAEQMAEASLRSSRQAFQNLSHQSVVKPEDLEEWMRRAALCSGKASLRQNKVSQALIHFSALQRRFPHSREALESQVFWGDFK